MGFSRQEYWSGLTCPPSGDLPNPRMELMSLKSPALAGGLPLAPLGKPLEISSGSLRAATKQAGGNQEGRGRHKPHVVDGLKETGGKSG